MVATGFAVFGIGASSLLFLGGKSWVYHEGLLWATALCLGAFNHLVRWLLGTGAVSRARLGHLAGAVLLAGLAINTRSTVGFGPVAALGLTAAVLAITLLAGRSQPDALLARVASGAQRLSGWHPRRSTGAAPLALVVIVVGMVAAVVLYASVNTARFDSWFGVPLDRQVLVADDLERQAALAANDNSLFGPQYVPSVLLQILRPNALGVRPEFPYLAFPGERPTVVGDAVFSELDWSSSVPVSEPLLFLAGLVGVAALLAPRRLLAAPGVRRVGGTASAGAAPEVVAVRIAAGGAAIGGGVFIAFGYIAQRYLTDLFPLLVLCALVGLHTLGANIAARARSDAEQLPGPDPDPDEAADSDERQGPSAVRMASWGLTAAIALTALWGGWVNTSLALQYQQEVSPGRTRPERVDWVETQDGLPGAIGTAVQIGADEPLPPWSPIGLVAVVGDCQAVYRSNGEVWYLLESTPPAGGGHLSVQRDGPLTEPVPIARLQGDDPATRSDLLLEPVEGGRVRLTVQVQQGSEAVRSWVSSEFELPDGSTTDFDVTMDWRIGEVTVSALGDDDERLRVQIALPPGELAPVGGGALDVSMAVPPTPLCNEVVR